MQAKIDTFNENAEKLGEEGQIEEAESVMLEAEKLKKQKGELEILLKSGGNPASLQQKHDKTMKVCEVCGALQAATDTEKRMTMHLEGKLHTGYLKIRRKLEELKKRRSEHRSRRSRSRSRSPGRGGRNKNNNDLGEDEGKQYESKIIFSSHVHGSGRNVPSQAICSINFTDLAI